MAQVNGYFQIDIRSDGTWIVIYPPQEDGKAVRFDMIDSYLTKWRIDYDKKALSDALVKASKEVRLTTEKLYPINEFCTVTVAPDRLSAEMILYPPSKDGSMMTREDLVSKLVHVGVKYGLDQELLDKIDAEREYCTPLELAKATLPVEGKSAEIKYYFNTDLSMKPKILEDGSVDFHTLDTICSVKEGDLLAELIPAEQGTPGIDVCGRQIKPSKVNNLILRGTKRSHVSEDGLKLYSDVNGHVSLVDGTVFVSDTYEVEGDVDSSTGDIVCEGNVEVKGNVRTGYKVEAKGNVIVNGVVEGAEIIAGGQIILKRGIQGMTRGKLIAEGNIISKFIENAEVISRYGYVQCEASLHSRISAKTDVIVNGKKGFISGGNTRCGRLIEAKTIGSSMGTVTVLEVGVDPAIVEECHRLEKQIMELQAEKEKIEQTIVMLVKKIKSGEQLPMDKLVLLKQSQERVAEIDTIVEQNDKQLEELQDDMDMKGNSMIKVSQTAYSGCRITIGGAVYQVKTELAHARFVKDHGDVRIDSY
ncbi:MAG: DUF342 domain-containing protein [Lachnospiraceae bacterium]|nr:DUF342 domain-containing protein [Lachnospiraceae bacterium]